ncbi:hypothetical protein HK101_006643 [Irineochytrium annulatum]|nr:hypothetical protein HK101_006643 [Irineochytrium annulatum]
MKSVACMQARAAAISRRAAFSTSPPSAPLHKPVLVSEILTHITPPSPSISASSEPLVFVDATFGCGGHTRALLDAHPSAHVIAVDQDPGAVERALELEREDAYRGRLTPVRGRFGDIRRLVQHALGVETPSINGIIYDLGVCSTQLDDGHRGFSIKNDGPLDMRMCHDSEHPMLTDPIAEDYSYDDLRALIAHYGEDTRAARIARSIVYHRTRHGPIFTTSLLADIIARAYRTSKSGRASPHDPHTHPATRTFQAIRIHVNGELDDLRATLHQAEAMLVAGGRLAIVSFHSLEDRIVKRFMKGRCGLIKGNGMRYWKRMGVDADDYKEVKSAAVRDVGGVRGMEDVLEDDRVRMMAIRDRWAQEAEKRGREEQDGDHKGDVHEPSFRMVTKKAIKPGQEEVEANGRSRSAKLRVAERTAAAAMQVFGEDEDDPLKDIGKNNWLGR